MLTMTAEARALLRCSAAAAAIGLGLMSAPALAQGQATAEAEPAATADTIIITGTRIARPNIEQSSPVSVVGESEFNFQQPISVERVLRDLPGVAAGINPAVNNGTNGTASLNLRGLGSGRNVVLLNSRRVVPSTLGGAPDLNVIPVAMIERAEVFTGGASTIYGADAIAGVVNFITRQDFAGVDLSTSYGISGRGDGQSLRTDLTIGANFDNGRGNAVFSIGYTKQDPVLQGDRQIGLESRASTCNPAQTNPAAPNFCGAPRGNPQGSGAATPATIFAPFTAAVVPGSPTFAVGQTNNYNFNPLNVFVTPLDRVNLFAQARYEISPAVTVYSEGFYVRSRVTQQIAPSATFFNAFRLPLNNQFLTPQQSQQLCQAGVNLRQPEQGPGSPIRPTAEQCNSLIPGGSIQLTFTDAQGNQITRPFSSPEIDAIVARRFTEFGPRRTEFTSNVWQIVGGLRGPLTSTLDWDASFTYGEADRVNTGSGQGLFERFQQSVRGCPAGSAAGCVPINLFGGEGSIPLSVFQFLDVATNTFTRTDILTLQGTISGDLGIASPLAEEPIGVAVGVEYRRYGGAQRGDLPSSTPGAVLGAGGAFLSFSGQYDTKEAFLEIAVPLIEDRPFFHRLTFEGGVRYSDYSTSGGNWTWKAGGSWLPVPEVKIRGIYSKAVRAPNISELFAPINTVLSNRAVDPCQGTVAEIQARGPNFQALCVEQLNRVGAGGLLGLVPAPFAGQINVTGGGNPQLDPETAETFTIGAVIQPPVLRNFAFTVDYFKIDLKDFITQPSQSDVIDGCFGQADPNFTFCQLIFRNPLTGGLSGDPSTTRGPVTQLNNLGRLKTEGVDFGLAFNHDFGDLRWSFNANVTYTKSLQVQTIPTAFSRECAGHYSISCDPPLPEWTSNVRNTFSIGAFDASLRWRYLHPVTVEPRTTCLAGQFQPGDKGNCGPANPFDVYKRIGAYHYFDLALAAQVDERLRLILTIDNLFDRKPPDVGNTIGSTAFNSGNTYPSVYDAVGRSFRMGAQLRF